MTELVFCYHCRRQHPADEVTLVHGRGVRRWRCRKSIALSRNSTIQRDAFGKAVSQLNQSNAVVWAARPLPRPVLELFVTAPRSIDGMA